MNDRDTEWLRAGATLSNKTASKEFGLTYEEIVKAIRSGKLQYRVNYMHGNPWFRLLRREVEALVKGKHGKSYLKDRQTKTELTRIDRELKKLKAQIADLEKQKVKLMKHLEK
jgi:hypothetical protein